MNSLYNLYKKKIIYNFLKKFNCKSIMEVPKITKIVLSVSLNSVDLSKNKINNVLLNLKLISGQLPVIIKSKKSISSFKIRKNFPIGCKVTLRKKIMWFFLDKLIFIVIPRIRDFRGISKKSFDKYGNLNIGIKEHIIFPEIDYEKAKYIHGMNISIVIRNKNIKESIFLLSSFSFPFKN